jgi:hypothetical protein
MSFALLFFIRFSFSSFAFAVPLSLGAPAAGAANPLLNTTFMGAASQADPVNGVNLNKPAGSARLEPAALHTRSTELASAIGLATVEARLNIVAAC